MRTHTNITLSPRVGLVTSTFAILAARVVAAWRRIKEESFSRQALNRRVLYRLSVLSDRELADIGLSHQDVTAAAMSENGDATRFLVARQGERRRARRGRSPF